MQPFVSIIVPVYNTGKYLSKCIQSVLSQTYTKWELILVNDGSTDCSAEICKEYADKDNRIKVFSQLNAGLSAARNTGLEHCNGLYISFLDSDDWIAPSMLELMVEACIHNDSQIAICGRFDVSEKGGKTINGLCPSRSKVLSPEECLSKILTWDGMDVAVCDKMFSRSIWEDIRFPVSRINEDAAVIMKVVSRARRIAVIRERLYYYFHRAGSITTSVFSAKTFHCIDHADAIQNYMHTQYPQIEDPAEYYCFREYSHVFKKMILQADLSLPEYKEKFRMIEQKLKHLAGSYNAYFSFREKLRLFMIKIGWYEKIYHLLYKTRESIVHLFHE